MTAPDTPTKAEALQAIRQVTDFAARTDYEVAAHCGDVLRRFVEGSGSSREPSLSITAKPRERLTGELHGYDPDCPEHLGWDLRLTADNMDSRAGYATSTGQTLRIAAHQFDGLPIATSHNAALTMARALSSATQADVASSRDESND